MVEELLPASVAPVSEMDMDEGIVPGSDRFVDKGHVGVAWCTAAFSDVAAGAGTNNILPGGFSAHASGDDVVE